MRLSGSHFLPLAALLLVPLAANAQTATVDGPVALSVLTALCDELVSARVAGLSLLAETREVQSGRWEWMRPALTALAAQGVPAVIWYARPDGAYYTVEKGLTDQNLKDRAYFQKLLGGVTTPEQELIISKSTGKQSLVVAVPVLVRGKLAGILGASIYLEAVSERLTTALVGCPRMIFFALAPDGRTAFHCQRQRLLVDPRAMGVPSLTAAVARMLKEPSGSTTYEFEGKVRDVIWQTSPVTGFRVVLGFIR